MIGIIDELEEWCAKRGFARVADLTGAMIDEPPMETFAAAAADRAGPCKGVAECRRRGADR